MSRYNDSTPNEASTAERNARADAQGRVALLEANINAFIAAVEEVTFNVAEADALPWMDNWQANLLSGNLTAAPEVVEEVVEFSS